MLLLTLAGANLQDTVRAMNLSTGGISRCSLDADKQGYAILQKIVKHFENFQLQCS